MELIIENKKLFIALFGIVVVIMLIVLWSPEKDIELSHYEELSEAQIDNISMKQYGDEIKLAMYSQDTEFLNDRISEEYLKYIESDKSNYTKWLENNNILTTNIHFGQTKKYTYGNTNIYSISAIINGDSRSINIIEYSPENWEYTFDTFAFFSDDSLKYSKDGREITIDGIYQDLNYVEINCTISSDDLNEIIDVDRIDNIRLVTEEGNSIIMATNSVETNESVINNRKYMSIKCLFNISINNQYDIESIKFNVFEESEEEINIRLSI